MSGDILLHADYIEISEPSIITFTIFYTRILSRVFIASVSEKLYRSNLYVYTFLTI